MPLLSGFDTHPSRLVGLSHVVLIGGEALVVTEDRELRHGREVLLDQFRDLSLRQSLVSLGLMPDIVRSIVTSPNDHIDIADLGLRISKQCFDGTERHVTLSERTPVLSSLGRIRRSRTTFRTAAEGLSAISKRTFSVLEICVQVSQMEHLESRASHRCSRSSRLISEHLGLP